MITPEKIQKQCDLLADLLKRKNADYGDSFSEAPYLLPKLSTTSSAYVRLSDKFHRLRTLLALTEQDRRVVEESIEDTLRDVAGYCILLLAYANASIDLETTKEKEMNDGGI